MKRLFDDVSFESSKLTTKAYSTSFSMGISLLDKSIRKHVYAIYGFVRFADEIVDTFHDYPKAELLQKFRADTVLAIQQGISLNPILNSFQHTVNEYAVDWELIDTFLKSMEMDLNPVDYDQSNYETYILGSAEVVGLMCLKVFCYGDEELYQKAKPQAMSLGSAFQKINFLRDAQEDYEKLGRTYFPGVDLSNFDNATKKQIEKDIEHDFKEGFKGIQILPKSSRFGVYIAYVYYYKLFRKIQGLDASEILKSRIRIPNKRKYTLFVGSYLRHNLNIL